MWRHLCLLARMSSGVFLLKKNTRRCTYAPQDATVRSKGTPFMGEEVEVQQKRAPVTSSIIPNSIREYLPYRPSCFGLNTGVAHTAYHFFFYPNFVKNEHILHFFVEKFGFRAKMYYLCTRKLTLGCLRDISE